MGREQGKRRKVRADQLVVARGLAGDQESARALIMSGKVLADEQRVAKSGDLLPESCVLRVKGQETYVSRGGDKLAGALRVFGLTDWMRDRQVLDVGASTGGFTDCCLKHGARHVTAVDVGTNQLAWEIRQDSRVSVREQTDLRAYDGNEGPFDIIVADISFNSLARMAPDLARLARPGALALLLVKPQFELPAAEVPAGGVVLLPELRQKAVDLVSQSLAAEGFVVRGQADSAVAGRSGNVEIFLLCERVG